MKFLKGIRLILNWKSMVLSGLSLAATFICIHYQLTADLPLTLLGIAVVFPIVFSISEAYKRRETSLALYGNLKAHCRSLYFSSRDWVEKDNPKDRIQMKLLLTNTLLSIKELLSSERESVENKENEVYQKFSQISIFIKDLRNDGLASGEASRANQYISKMLEAFENMKHIYQYRTPRALHYYSKVFIYSTPILYAPYFAHISKSIAFGLIFITPILLTTMLVGLDTVQSQLENPFDQYGVDDVKINPEKFAEHLSD